MLGSVTDFEETAPGTSPGAVSPCLVRYRTNGVTLIRPPSGSAANWVVSGFASGSCVFRERAAWAKPVATEFPRCGLTRLGMSFDRSTRAWRNICTLSTMGEYRRSDCTSVRSCATILSTISFSAACCWGLLPRESNSAPKQTATTLGHAWRLLIRSVWLGRFPQARPQRALWHLYNG